ncbi:gliding motility lipoprotein GldH [Flavobacteriales bacterium]|nr:gliding motility lipoprotein GldH [Flavobacteriales bacterium]
MTTKNSNENKEEVNFIRTELIQEIRKKVKPSSLIFFFLLVLIACTGDTVFEQHKSFEDQSWNADSAIIFNCLVEDTVSQNQWVIKVRHTVEYEFQNLFLFIKAEKVDTIEIQLANKEGRWIGRGVGDIRKVDFVYKEKEIFSKKGELVVKLEQAMRYGDFEKIQQLKNIESIGFRVEKND